MSHSVHSLLLIAAMAAVTFFTRALPFLLFDHGKEPPQIVLRLSRTLPPAIMAMLVVYCLRELTFAAPGGWVPALAACLLVVALQWWKNNDLLSILGGTACYMALLHWFG